MNFQGKLVPSDDITIYYNATGSLARIIPEYKDFIFSTIKQPIRVNPVPASAKAQVIVQENAKVWI